MVPKAPQNNASAARTHVSVAENENVKTQLSFVIVY
jgi:hypothetical protein